MIWAQANGGVIGDSGTIPWHLPADVAHFQRLTKHHTVLMGRRTWESLPDGYRPLPDRRNIVLSRDKAYRATGAIVTNSLLAALDMGGALPIGSRKQIWVIGGAEVYRKCIPMATRLVITTIDQDIEGDTYAPTWRTSEWEMVEQTAGDQFTIADWRRKPMQ